MSINCMQKMISAIFITNNLNYCYSVCFDRQYRGRKDVEKDEIEQSSNHIDPSDTNSAHGRSA